jgi:methylated-DNA-[protein]-cysteine S-methyltransferase
MPFTTYDSPLGPLTLVGGPRGLSRLAFAGGAPALAADDRDDAPFGDAIAELDRYFAGAARDLAVRLDLDGTPFQRLVWDAVGRIPYGARTTYGALAREVGALRSRGVPEVRAVAAAVAATPVPIVIPCHRIVAANGALTGYSGGLQLKAALLAFEASGGRHLASLAGWPARQLALC